MVQDTRAWGSGKRPRDQEGQPEPSTAPAFRVSRAKGRREAPSWSGQKGAKFSFIPGLGVRSPRRSWEEEHLHRHPQEQGEGAAGTVV